MTEPKKTPPLRTRPGAWPWAVLAQLAGVVMVAAGGVALFGVAVTVFGVGVGLVAGGGAAEAAKVRQGAAAAKRRRQADAFRRVA